MLSRLRLRFVSLATVTVIIGSAAMTSTRSLAQTLTGAALFNSAESGSFSGKEYWITGNRCAGWRLYFRNDNKWYNDADSNIRIPLAPGVQTFRFYAEGGGEFPYAGLSLFFDNEENTPALCVSAKIAQRESEKPAIRAAQGRALRTDHTAVPSTCTLVYDNGETTVELMDFRLEHPSVEKIDLVGSHEPTPNSHNDYVGTLTLRVVAGPRKGSGAARTSESTPLKSLTLTGHTGEVSSALVSPDGKYLVTCGDKDDKTARVWSMSSGKQLLTLFESPAILAAQFSPDSKCVLAAIGNNTAQVWSLENGRVLYTLSGHTGPINGMTYSPKGDRIATGSSDGTARVWDAKTGTQLMVLRGHSAAVLSVTFSGDGKRLVTTGRDKVVKIWEVAPQANPSP